MTKTNDERTSNGNSESVLFPPSSYSLPFGFFPFFRLPVLGSALSGCFPVVWLFGWLEVVRQRYRCHPDSALWCCCCLVPIWHGTPRRISRRLFVHDLSLVIVVAPPV